MIFCLYVKSHPMEFSNMWVVVQFNVGHEFSLRRCVRRWRAEATFLLSSLQHMYNNDQRLKIGPFKVTSFQNQLRNDVLSNDPSLKKKKKFKQ